MTSQPPIKKAKLVGFDNFVRTNPMSDRTDFQSFHHLEFFCSDASTAAARFATALGFRNLAKSTMTTGNKVYASHVIGSGSTIFAFTAPYGEKAASLARDAFPAAEEWRAETCPNKAFSATEAHAFVAKHGLSAHCVGVRVTDAKHAYEQAVANGAISMAPPYGAAGYDVCVAEVRLYPDSDARLRFVSGGGLDALPFLPGYTKIDDPSDSTYGIQRVDHVVGNVPDLLAAVDYLAGFTGFHEFAEFTTEDVGTVDSGLNSMVLASNNEKVLLPINEPTAGKRRKSQILTYLEQHDGPGVQHVALKTDDIFATVAAMRAAHAARGGFELMERPRKQYYENLPSRLGDEALSPQQRRQCEELGILADKDDQGVLLQVFTKPIGDRATLFLEIIQRIGCTEDPVTKREIEQTAGCGGFGKGNFHELFRAIEEYETRAGINKL